MRLSFRHRLFIGLVTLGAVPLAVAIIVLAIQANASSSPAGPRAALDAIAESGHDLTSRIDTLALRPDGRAALQEHSDIIARGTTLARRAEALSRLSATVLAVAVLISGVGLVAGSVYLAQRWSKSFSQPIENLIGWIRRIEKGQSLPAASMSYGTPEMEALGVALRNMATELEHARRRELEQQRLVAFREVARRVAHEIRGPLTASRLAISQLERDAANDPSTGPLNVLKEETERLDTMAREFSEFGRLPEGQLAPIDVSELITNVVASTVPADVPARSSGPPQIVVTGYYEPLRRAVQNLVRNAIDATDTRGIHITAAKGIDAETIEIRVKDFGPGVKEDDIEQIFQPYVTTKPGGTGLGLAIVKQVVEAHRGTITVESTANGTTFIMTLPVDDS